MANLLNQEQRRHHLAAAGSQHYDVVVIGGGVTGAGIALDATTRGLRTLIVEAQDWASGTSSRSSRLVHGGLRYLYQLDFKLVAEALHERGLLLTTIAPHLVKAQPFLWPLKTPVIERAYSAVGVGMYDALALAGARGKTVPLQRHRTRAGAIKRFPDIKASALSGAIEFYDARVDDARLVIDLVRTAVSYGAHALSRAQVERIEAPDGKVSGLRLRDLESGELIAVHTDGVINATGVWTQPTQDLVDTPQHNPGLRVLASKGIHILVDRGRINAQTGIFLRTDKSVLFIIPWQHYWVIGTTDTSWHEQLEHPVPTAADIDYVLQQANQVLARPLTRQDIIGTYAGLRPLLQPVRDKTTTKVSREHAVATNLPGMVSVAGGKLTTYRVMAKDAVDELLGRQRAAHSPSVTDQTPLVGAQGLGAVTNQARRIGQIYGWDKPTMVHLLGRYGSELTELTALVDEQPDLARPLAAAPNYLRVEVAYACRAEGAAHLEDILIQRVRLNSEQRDRGAAAVSEVAELAARFLNWSAQQLASEQDNYLARIAAELAGEQADDDAAASAARLAGVDIVANDLGRLSGGQNNV